ncbi:MAG: TonB-dependent receptor [Rubrivivax sp.]|nr:TonB-dependent receptor [Pyrinomonadaceae bacterium]
MSAQTINGNIVGTITDEQGAAVPGVTVTATNTGTGATRTATTNDEGSYRIAALPVGDYAVKAEKTGFSSANATVGVSVGIDSNADVTLKTGGVTENVTVVATGALLDTTQSQVAKTVDQTRILELPGRNTLNGLALLNPGVLPNQNNRPGSGFAVNGNRTRSNNFTIDGANNNDQSLSIPRQNLPPEAIGEFQIITNNFAAEFGRNAGSYVNQITRSGTNEYHGTGFYSWAGNGLDSLTTAQQRTFNQLRANTANAALSDKQLLRQIRDVTVDNTYGFTVGGPVKRNHTFFFTSLDLNDFRTTVSSVSRAAITQASANALRANRTRFASPGAVDFLLSTYPVANLAACPVANCNQTVTGTNGFTLPLQFATFNRTLTQGIPYGNDFARWLGKINTKINDKDQLSFRYLIDQTDDPGAPASIPGLEIGQKLRNQSFTVNDVYAISPTFINEARFTYSRRKLNSPEDLTQFAQGAQVQVNGIPGNAFNGGNANFPQNRLDNVYEWTENMSWMKGNHNLKWGANILRYQLNSFFAPNSRGFIFYSSFNNLLADNSGLIQKANGDFGVNAVTYENSFFIQDDYRFNSDLTFNLGLRYEYVTAPFGYFSNAKPDINNFGPSVGFAYNPKDIADGRMVFRGGFRVSYDQVFQNILLNVSRNHPRAATFSAACAGCAPFDGIANSDPFFNQEPSAVPAAAVPFLDFRLFSPNERIKQPMSWQWSVGGQYQFGSDYVVKLDYIGTKGSNLVREVEQNFGFVKIAGLEQFGFTGIRNDPTRGSILVGQGIANSIYHSGQITFEKRFSNLDIAGTNFGGLLFNTNFTYSMFISEADDVLGGQANRTLPADPRNPGLDRARSGFDQPRRFVASYVWQSPELFKDNAILSRVLSGWEIAGVTTLADGTPYSVLNTGNPLGVLAGQISTISQSQRVQLVNPNATSNSFTLGSVVTANGVRSLVFADPNARYGILPQNSGFVGNLGANTERTGGTANTNLAAVKNIRTFGETQRLQLRAEIINVFNRRNFTTIPTNIITENAVATPTNFLNLGLTNITGRGFLFGARYHF